MQRLTALVAKFSPIPSSFLYNKIVAKNTAAVLVGNTVYTNNGKGLNRGLVYVISLV
jgi:hypothetical protein